MVKKDKNSADGKTAEVAHHTRAVRGDEELGADEKVVAELAAEEGNESPLEEEKKSYGVEEESEKSRGLSGEDDIRPAKT